MFQRLAALAGSFGIAATALMSGHVMGVRAQEVNQSGAPSDAIVFEGQAVITSDSDADVPPAAELINGSGTLSFSSSVCAGSSDPPATGLAEASVCSITASGSFVNAVCGTEFISGTATVTGAVESGTSNFAIIILAGIGVVTGDWSGMGPDDAAADSPPEPLDGVVVLTAPVPPTTGGGRDAGGVDCTSGFTIAGAVVATEP